MSDENKSAGQIAYERYLQNHPIFKDGTPRKTWDELPQVVRNNWHEEALADPNFGS